MIRRETVMRVKAMLALKKYSHRKIARELGISRGSVERISKGLTDPPECFEKVDVYRCPICGNRVSLRPCLSCTLLSLL